MVRKTSLAIALALGITPLGVNALGLGDIQLNSGLNQYLNADIELLSVGKEDIADIKVKLASPEAFERAGVDRSFLLSKLRFKAQKLPDGTTAVHITSRDPIREPFLNFLIEMDWPKGKLVREYTVLLDPPVTLERKPAPIQVPRAAAKPQHAIVQQPSQPAEITPDVSWAEDAQAATEYGPTKKNDTLWGIAKSTRQQGMTMEQAMIALFRANPDAFIKDNINRLKVGEILRVPPQQETLSLSAREAREAFRAELNRWEADAAAKPAKSVSTPIASKPTPATVSEEAVPEAELKIATARPEGLGEAGPAEGGENAEILENLQNDLALAEEAKQSAIQEGEELKSRVDDLELQLQDMQRLLELKNEQLAQLQAARAKSEEAMQAATGQLAQTEQTEAAVPEAQQTQPAEDESASAKPAATMAEVKPAPKSVAVVKPKPVEKNFLDTLLGDTKMLGIVGGVAIVLLALVWVFVSRRRAEAEVADFQESILVSTIDDTDSEQVSDQLIEDDEDTETDETSFLSDFSPSDIDALQDETGEVDPLAETDVYIAYGRYQQAEELITQAIEKNPERIELKHKLFEILNATQESDKFVALAEQCVAEGVDSKDTEAWAKVVTMGALLAPGHELFSGAMPMEESIDEESEFNLDDLSDELDLESEMTSEDDDDLTLGSLDLDDINSLDEDTEEQADELDLDLGLDFGLGDESEEISDKPEEKSEEDLAASLEEDEFDLGLDLGLGEESIDADTTDTSFSLDTGETEAEEDVGLDLDIGSSIEETLDAESGISDLEFDLAESDDTQSEGLLNIEDTLESAELDDLGAAEASVTDSDTEKDIFSLEGLDDETDNAFTDADEVNTKLDLAKAYIDLGDADGAREILEEALSEGNDTQKQEAQSLIQALA